MWSNDHAKSRFNGVVSTYSTFLNIWLVDLLGHFLDGQKKLSTSAPLKKMVMKTSDSSIFQGLFGFFRFFHLQEAHKTTHHKRKNL